MVVVVWRLTAGMVPTQSQLCITVSGCGACGVCGGCGGAYGCAGGDAAIAEHTQTHTETDTDIHTETDTGTSTHKHALTPTGHTLTSKIKFRDVLPAIAEHSHRHRNTQTDTHRQTHRQTHPQTDRQTDRQTDTHTHSLTPTGHTLTSKIKFRDVLPAIAEHTHCHTHRHTLSHTDTEADTDRYRQIDTRSHPQATR